MSYTAAFRAACRQQRPLIVPLVEVSWPDGTVGRYSSSGVATAAGPFEDRVETVEDVDEKVGILEPDLQSLSCTLTLMDDDRALVRMLEGAQDCRRCPVTIYWGGPGLAKADWHVHLAGLLDSWSYHDGTLVDLTIRTDERWLSESKVPRFPLLKGDVPDVPDTSLGIYLPELLGGHDGQSLSGKGFVPTIRVRFVASTTCWDVPLRGVARSVPRVYLAGTLKTVTTHYTVGTEMIGGKACTAIKWTAGNIPAATDVVQCDVEGLTADGTAAGTLITNPVTQLRTWLVNFAWGSWKSGAWLSETGSPIHAASWSACEALAARLRLEGSIYVGGTTKQEGTRAVVDSWLQTWQMFRPYWTPSGQLALGALSFDWAGNGVGDEWDLLREEDCESSPRTSDDVSGLVSRVSMTHLFEVAAGKSWGSLDVEDVSRPEQVTDSIEMRHSAARF